MKYVIWAVGVCVVIGAAVAGVKWRQNAAAANTGTIYKTTKADYSTVKKTVSATGTLQPWTTVDIKSKAGGRIDAMLVDVGSVVKKGQVLVKIDPSDTQLSVDQARADIDSADAKIGQTRVTWQLGLKQSRLAVDQAAISYQSAVASRNAVEARLNSAREQRAAQPGITSATIESARANLESAQKQLTQMREATHPQDRASSQASLDQAKATLTNAQANLSRQKRLLEKGYVSQQVVDEAQAAFEVARASASSAQRKLDTLDRQLEAEEAAEVARVKQAEAQWRNAQAGSVDVKIKEAALAEAQADLRQADKSVENARAALILAKANVANNQVRKGDMLSSEASRLRAEATYKNAAVTLSQTIVRAPSDGVILQKYVEQGTIISSALSFAATGNNILELGDVSRMYVDVQVDETDIANVDVGQNVDITVDAYPGIPFEGKVSRINPMAQVDSNVTTVHVRVELDNSSPSFRLLKPTMNATCEFVLNKEENVLAVPSEAVHTDDSGSYVEVAAGGKQAPADPGAEPDPSSLVGVKIEKRKVEIGVEGNDDTEIKSGLKQGDVVVTQTVEPVSSTSTGTSGALGSMRPPGGRR